jgi:beta-phosphoglucomutase-like phosphatase (HAD superfamily)
MVHGRRWGISFTERDPMGLAVILDMDGLMLDTEPVSERAWKTAASEMGYAIEDALFAQMIGCNMASVHQLLFARFGGAFPADQLGCRARALYRKALDADGVAHKTGLLDLLAFLDAWRVPRAVGTSSAHGDARYQLDRAGILHRFDAVVGGDQVDLGKPKPDLFLLAARKLGARPADCVVLEDSDPGISAAQAAGMTSILVPDSRDPAVATRQAAYAVVDSLVEARDVLERLLTNQTGRV